MFSNKKKNTLVLVERNLPDVKLFFQSLIRFPGPTHTHRPAVCGSLEINVCFCLCKLTCCLSLINEVLFYWLDSKIILTRQKCVCVNLFSPWKQKRSGVLVPGLCCHLHRCNSTTYVKWCEVTSHCLLCPVNSSKPQKVTFKWLLYWKRL